MASPKAKPWKRNGLDLRGSTRTRRRSVQRRSGSGVPRPTIRTPTAATDADRAARRGRARCRKTPRTQDHDPRSEWNEATTTSITGTTTTNTTGTTTKDNNNNHNHNNNNKRQQKTTWYNNNNKRQQKTTTNDNNK